MQTGFEAVKASVERAKNSGGGGGYLNYFGWKDGDRKIIRFLTDEVITCDWYDFVVTRDGKNAGSFPNPLQVGYEEDFVRKYGGLTKKDNQLVPAVAHERTVGVAVLREERPVTRDGQSRTEVTDAIQELEISGTKYDSHFFGVVGQSYRNFWATVVGYFSRYGTICDRDYEITRVGTGTDTQYTIIPCDPIDGLRTTEEVQKHYGYGVTRSPEDKDRFLYCPTTLASWIKEQGAEEYIKTRLGNDTASSMTSNTSEVSQTTTDQSGLSTFKSTDTSSSLRDALIQNR